MPAWIFPLSYVSSCRLLMSYLADHRTVELAYGSGIGIVASKQASVLPGAGAVRNARLLTIPHIVAVSALPASQSCTPLRQPRAR
jgi:hypothetical protein